MSDSILTHVYPNGLVLLGEPMPWLRSAAFTFLVPAGCARDPIGQEGLASFTCEMVLRGAGARDNRELTTALDNLGVDRYETVGESHLRMGGATLAENLMPAMDLYADILLRPHLPGDELEAGRLVMLQELHGVEDDPAQKVMIELRRRYYPVPWGRPSQGTQESIEAATLDQVCRFFGDHYRPNGTILGVAGRFEWESLKQCVGALFADWKPRQAGMVPEQAAGPRCAHIDAPLNQTQIGVAYSTVPYAHPDYLQAWSAVGVLSGGTSTRPFLEVREKRGLCYTVYASYHTLRDRAGVFCYAGTGTDRAQETLDVLLHELVRLGKGIDGCELQRLKARSKSTLVMQQESSAARSTSIARDWYLLGRARTLDEVAGLIDGLTCESINRYLAAHPPGAFTIVTLGPRELEVPVGVS